MSKNLAKDGVILILGLLLGLLVGLAVIFAWSGELPVFAGNLNSQEYARVGGRAPDFTLLSLSGEAVRLSDHKGKPVIINFWATWCGPCRLEMPMIEKYHRSHGEDVAILAVNMQEESRAVSVFVNELGLSFPVLLDLESEVSSLYRVQGLPTTYFIDSEGAISALHIGVLSETQLDGYLEKVGISK